MDLPLTSIGTAAQPCSHDVPPGKMQLLYECIHPLIISQCRVLKASHVVRIADSAWLSSWLFCFAFCLPVIMVNTSNIMVMVWFGIGSLMGYGMDGVSRTEFILSSLHRRKEEASNFCVSQCQTNVRRN